MVYLHELVSGSVLEEHELEVGVVEHLLNAFVFPLLQQKKLTLLINLVKYVKNKGAAKHNG